MVTAAKTASTAHRRCWLCQRCKNPVSAILVLDFAMIFRALLVQRFHEGNDMIRVGKLADAMPQVEDMSRPMAIAVEDSSHFGMNRRRTRKQYVGVEVTL